MGDATSATQWTNWEVEPESGFEVSGDSGIVGLRQISPTAFLVTERFRFGNDHFENDILRLLKKHGTESGEERREMLDTARTFTPTDENATDLASIPPFMRWFENTYGSHTLAAIIHDELIVGTPNGGALKSDTLSDRFFRHMLEASGVPWLKRWIIWAAVALRSRWAAGGWRRVTIVVWTLVALAGIGSFLTAVAMLIGGQGFTATVGTLLGLALILPFLAAPLWGSQWGASVVAALAGVFVIPGAVSVLAGTVVYTGIEKAAALGRGT